MSSNRPTQEVEEYENDPLEEGYWIALLRDGEYAKSVNNEPNCDKLVDDNTQSNNNLSRSSDAVANPSDWENITKVKDDDETLLLEVVGYNRGGLLVEWKSLRGFVPASQVVSISDASKTSLANYVGKILSLRVIELDIEKNRLVFSERAAQVESGIRLQTLHTLQEETIVEGQVTNLCDFGAFVDLGGVEGLIHISELSWGRVAHPADMLTNGEKVKVYILDVNEAEERIALSLKRLYDDPWETVNTRYQIGEIVEGYITNVVDFGAFTCIEEGLEGLIHFSELAEGQFLHPRNVVSENDVVKARILSINSKAKRIALSLRGI